MTTKAKKPNKVGGSSKWSMFTAEGIREDGGRVRVLQGCWKGKEQYVAPKWSKPGAFTGHCHCLFLDLQSKSVFRKNVFVEFEIPLGISCSQGYVLAGCNAVAKCWPECVQHTTANVFSVLHAEHQRWSY